MISTTEIAATYKEWKCSCGMVCDPMSPDWLWNGADWEHRHDLGLVKAIRTKPVENRAAPNPDTPTFSEVLERASASYDRMLIEEHMRETQRQVREQQVRDLMGPMIDVGPAPVTPWNQDLTPSQTALEFERLMRENREQIRNQMLNVGPEPVHQINDIIRILEDLRREVESALDIARRGQTNHPTVREITANHLMRVLRIGDTEIRYEVRRLQRFWYDPDPFPATPPVVP